MITALGRNTAATVRSVGRLGQFLSDTVRALPDVGIWFPLTITQMRRVGVDSLPVALFIAEDLPDTEDQAMDRFLSDEVENALNTLQRRDAKVLRLLGSTAAANTRSKRSAASSASLGSG